MFLQRVDGLIPCAWHGRLRLKDACLQGSPSRNRFHQGMLHRDLYTSGVTIVKLFLGGCCCSAALLCQGRFTALEQQSIYITLSKNNSQVSQAPSNRSSCLRLSHVCKRNPTHVASVHSLHSLHPLSLSSLVEHPTLHSISIGSQKVLISTADNTNLSQAPCASSLCIQVLQLVTTEGKAYRS